MSITQENLLEIEAHFRAINHRSKQQGIPVKLDFECQNSRLKIILYGPDLPTLLQFWPNKAALLVTICKKNFIGEILYQLDNEKIPSQLVDATILNAINTGVM